jgi:predicted hotdog family 3-hydroxylacyl-ACP dehydratase
VISRAEILELVPHAGAMCLIDHASSWDPNEIHCASNSHRDPANPLRRSGALAAVHLIEYAAQAAALHAALTSKSPTATRSGVLASVRDCELDVERLDELPQALQIHAHREARSADALSYVFEISHGARRLGRGRLMIRLGIAQP